MTMTITEAIAHYLRARRRLYETSSCSHPEFSSAAADYRTAIENARAAGCSEAQFAHIDQCDPAESILQEVVVIH